MDGSRMACAGAGRWGEGARRRRRGREAATWPGGAATSYGVQNRMGDARMPDCESERVRPEGE